MTILEAHYRYGAHEYRTSAGDTLRDLCRKIYGDDNDLTIKILRTLNIRYDWNLVAPNSTIKYLAVDILKYIDEV